MNTPHTHDERIQDMEYIISSLPIYRQVECGELSTSEASLRAQRGNNRQPGGPAQQVSADINLAGFLHGHKLEFVRIAVASLTLLKHHGPLYQDIMDRFEEMVQRSGIVCADRLQRNFVIHM